jgi:hypothetical protein
MRRWINVEVEIVSLQSPAGFQPQISATVEISRRPEDAPCGMVKVYRNVGFASMRRALKVADQTATEESSSVYVTPEDGTIHFGIYSTRL